MAYADGISTHVSRFTPAPGAPEPLPRLVFVKVFGFSDAERHTLNTVFRLSHESDGRQHAFALWTRDAPADAELVLIDGDNWEAALALANPVNDPLRLVWVGSAAPARAHLVFGRPLRWPAVIEGMDRLLARLQHAPLAVLHDIALPADVGPAAEQPVEPVHALPAAVPDASLDLDLSLALVPAARGTGLSAPYAAADSQHREAAAIAAMTAVTQPGALALLEETQPELAQALVVDADEASRLYWRAKLALAGVMQVHEACCGAEALQMLQSGRYRLVILDLGLRDMSGWELLKHVGRGRNAATRRAHGVLILTGQRLSWLQGVRGWLAGARSCVRKPFHPGNLHHLLLNMR